jgi:hypothetical protein
MKKMACIVLFFLIIVPKVYADVDIPNNLWRAIIAEDTSGNYETYFAIASCVRNRLEAGQKHGLVAMKRKNLCNFVEKECQYALKKNKTNLENQAKSAIHEAFVLKHDACNGATRFEHTGQYGTPKDNEIRRMKVAKVLFPNTKREITFWRKV